MSRIGTTRIVVGSALVGILAMFLATKGSVMGKAETSAPLKVGVVNLEKVMTVYPTKLEMEKNWQASKEQNQKGLQAMADEISAMMKELDTLDAKSDAAKAKRMLVAEKQATLQVRKNVAEQELVQRYKGALEVIYNDILSDVEEFRKAMGYDLIIESYNEPMKSASLDQLQIQMMRKVVLAANNTLDLTDRLIEYVKGAQKKTQ